MDNEEKSSSDKAAKKGGSGKLIIIIILLLVIIIAGGVGGFLFLKKGSADDGAVEGGEAAPIAYQQPAAAAPRNAATTLGPVVPYAPFTVNLADVDVARYLKTSLSLELSTEKNFPAEVTMKEAKIRDMIIMILSSKTYEEVNTPQGKVLLKQELLRKLNTIMSGGRIMDIYITEFVAQ